MEFGVKVQVLIMNPFYYRREIKTEKGRI